MKVLYHLKQRSFLRSAGHPWQGRFLCITHSDRRVELDRCSLNALEIRYSCDQRLPPRSCFTDLDHAANHTPYKGSISVWKLGGDVREDPLLVAHVHPVHYKPQHAAIHGGRLWILGTETLEAYDTQWNRLCLITDSWLSGGHTVFPGDNGTLVVSCSASDAVLEVEAASGRVARAMRMPEDIYGTNFHLKREDSVVDHFIPNDLQLTHINCAYPWQGGVLVSTLIQGAIGHFDRRGEYRQITAGFVGCHGVRAYGLDQFYFCDSCLGTINYMDLGGRLRRRIACDSAWLHDAQHLDDRYIATCPADRNSVEFVDTTTRDVVNAINCAPFGESPQFISVGCM